MPSPALLNLGHWEIAIIAGVVVLLFLGPRIPAAMRGLGRGIAQFRKGIHEDPGRGTKAPEGGSMPPAPGARAGDGRGDARAKVPEGRASDPPQQDRGPTG